MSDVPIYLEGVILVRGGAPPLLSRACERGGVSGGMRPLIVRGASATRSGEGGRWRHGKSQRCLSAPVREGKSPRRCTKNAEGHAEGCQSTEQGYLAHKKQPTPKDHHRSLGRGYCRVLRGRGVIMSEG